MFTVCRVKAISIVKPVASRALAARSLSRRLVVVFALCLVDLLGHGRRFSATCSARTHVNFTTNSQHRRVQKRTFSVEIASRRHDWHLLRIADGLSVLTRLGVHFAGAWCTHFARSSYFSAARADARLYTKRLVILQIVSAWLSTHQASLRLRSTQLLDRVNNRLATS